MKNLNYQSTRLGSQAGTVIVQVIVVGVLLSIMTAGVLAYFQHQSTVLASQRIADNVDALNNLITMTFSQRNICRTNLRANLFGLNKAALNPSVKARAQFPSPSGTLMKAGSRYESLAVEKINFTVPIQVRSSETSYISNLEIEVKDAGNPKAVRKTSVPFYFIESGGFLSDCFATTLPKPQPSGTRPMTMEDLACRKWQERLVKQNKLGPGPDFIYSPTQKTCVVGS